MIPTLPLPKLIIYEYSYAEGLSYVLKIIAIAAVIAIISTIVSLIIGLRKKDCLAVLIANIMVKTVLIVLANIAEDLLIYAICWIVSIIVEGLIYNKVLKYKKHKGMVVSIICNVASILTMLLIVIIIVRISAVITW